MKPGWYILNYHNVDWEDSILTRAIGGTTRPDVFMHHIETLREMGRFVSIDEGQQLLESGNRLSEALFSLWFDDGFSGVREYALPLCREMNISAGFSICSRFVLREELFWRCKLSYLALSDGMRFLRSRLRKSGLEVPLRLRSWSLDNFSRDLIGAIDEIYEQRSTEGFRRDAFRIFETPEGLQQLAQAGWSIANHSAGHYPLARNLGVDAVLQDFEECEKVVRVYNPKNRYWVIPFGYGSRYYVSDLQLRATVVDVGSRANTHDTWRATGRLFRFSAAAGRDVQMAFRHSSTAPVESEAEG